jgi:hypothetical protein
VQEEALVRTEELFLEEARNLASDIPRDNDGDITVIQINIRRLLPTRRHSSKNNRQNNDFTLNKCKLRRLCHAYLKV